VLLVYGREELIVDLSRNRSSSIANLFCMGRRTENSRLVQYERSFPYSQLNYVCGNKTLRLAPSGSQISSTMRTLIARSDCMSVYLVSYVFTLGQFDGVIMSNRRLFLFRFHLNCCTGASLGAMSLPASHNILLVGLYLLRLPDHFYLPSKPP
jgi:hypothetical protein